MRFKCVSASVKTAFAFPFVWCHNTCVSLACLYLLRRLLRFSSYGVKVHVFHMHLCIGLDVFFGIASQCMRFKCVSASVKTAFAFSFVWCYNICVSHACLHQLTRLLRFLRIALQCMRFTRVSAYRKTAFAFSLVWRQSTCVSHASLHRLRQLLRFFVLHHNVCVSNECLHRLRRLLRFPSYGVTIYTYHMSASV